MHASFTENCVELKEKWQNNRTHVLKICQIRNFEKNYKEQSKCIVVPQMLQKQEFYFYQYSSSSLSSKSI